MRFLRHALLTIVILVALAGLALFVMARRGLSARAEPDRFEAAVARNLRNLSTPSNAKELPNPFRDNANAWREGAEHFQGHCAVCHDADGRGRSVIGRNLYPRVPDLTRPTTQQLSDGEMYYIIANGVRWTGMPAWGGEDSPEEIWHLVSFIRHLPKLTAEELDAIASSSGERENEAPAPHTHGLETRPHEH